MRYCAQRARRTFSLRRKLGETGLNTAEDGDSADVVAGKDKVSNNKHRGERSRWVAISIIECHAVAH